MTLTSRTTLALALVLAVLAPVALVLLWRSRARHVVVDVGARLGGVLVCQALAVSALFLYVNDQYSFYSSWDDLLGRTAPVPGIQTAGLVRPGEGTLRVLSVPGDPTNGSSHQVLAWLPPGYDSPQAARTRYPVLMFLPGQPSDPASTFSHFRFAAVAAQEVLAHEVPPFVAVFPPLMTQPPRDTECTDVPGGPQAEHWLDHDVYGAVNADLRTDHHPWTEFGWSTGGFCAAKLLLHHPREFSAAVSLGGYYAPILDHTTGDLFAGRQQVRDENSPSWLYHRWGGMRGRRLLVVTGAQDRDSYLPTERFLRLVAGDPAVSSVVFPAGGHNYRNYAAYVGSGLEWLFHPPQGPQAQPAPHQPHPPKARPAPHPRQGSTTRTGPHRRRRG